MMYLRVDFLYSYIKGLEVLGASQISSFIYLISFGKISVIASSNISSFPVSSLSRVPIICTLDFFTLIIFPSHPLLYLFHSFILPCFIIYILLK